MDELDDGGQGIAAFAPVAAEIRKEGGKALVIGAHLGKLEEVQNVADKVVAELGGIDVLVNNAGTSPAFASFLETREKLWDSIINLNLKGLFFLSQAVAGHMQKKKSGCIINVASIDGFIPEQDNGVYAISKSGVLSATRVMAKELAPYNIRVNAVAPGYVHTRLLDSSIEVKPVREEEYLHTALIKRIADTEEIVGTMLYLASAASGYVTGHTLFVDGGYLKI